MSFLDTIRRAKAYLEEQGRVSLRALKLEFGLDDEQLEALIEELVDIQQLAAREGKAIAWMGGAARPGEIEPAAAPSAPAPGPASQAERRQLTVLFCDLVDSTTLASRLDAEDWREVVRHYQEVAADVVGRFAGYVAQYLGDGLLVYFGYPNAHEDDAERAVRGGLGIVDAIDGLNTHLETNHGLRLAVRVGIHTGPVVVGEMGTGESRETLAMGDTTNVAARLQGIAEPDTVVLSAATLHLAPGVFVTRDLGEHALKGLAEPVRAHRAVEASGVRSRLDVVAASELTPFVGRDQELMLLEDRFEQVAEGRGQVVLVCGEAGIGKSRLMQAFHERVAGRAHTWLECRGSPYTQDSSFHPVLELLRQALGFRREDADEAKLARIEAGLAAARFDTGDTVPIIAAMHSVALSDRYAAPNLSPEGLRKKTLTLMTDWLSRLGRQQPLVLLLEDVHWMDPSTLELLGQLLEQVPAASVLLLATYRPDFEPPWGARSFLTPMLLSRFTRAQLADLVRKAARDRDLPEAWLEEILRRADGVPLFAEELTRTVLETHPEPPQGGATPELQIPDTLQDSLMARLDALGPVKELAQLGAVLGREFSYDLLLKVSPLTEPELQQVLAVAIREELFYGSGTPPDASYLFKHALIRDTAYQSLLRGTRQRHHLRVAETLIDRAPELAREQPELVAQHLSQAGDAERAIQWWTRSGERANASVAYEEAIRHLSRGLELLDSLPAGSDRDAREVDLQLELGRALMNARGHAHAEVMRALERARAVCDSRRRPRQAALIAYHHAIARLVVGGQQAALDEMRDVLRIGRETDDDLLRIAGHEGAACPELFIGRFRHCLEDAEQAIALYDPALHDFTEAGFNEEEGITAFAWASLALWHLGLPGRARAMATRAVEVARQVQHPYTLAWVSALCAGTALCNREWNAARELAGAAAEIGSAQGLPIPEAVGIAVGATADGLGSGDTSAIERSLEGLTLAASTGNQGAEPWLLGNHAELQLEAGHLDEALGTVAGALAIGEQTGQHFRDAELLRLKGLIFLQMPDHTEVEAEALFRQAIDIARSQEAKSLELRAATSLARLWQRQGKRDEARDLLRPVYDWFTEGFDTQDLKDAKALLDEFSA